jgi:hypothetical protein
MTRRNKPERSPYAAKPCDEQAPTSCKPSPRSCKQKLGIDDITWAMMLMAIREPVREEQERDSA